jgi:hypothetical protein
LEFGTGLLLRTREEPNVQISPKCSKRSCVRRGQAGGHFGVAVASRERQNVSVGRGRNVGRRQKRIGPTVPFARKSERCPSNRRCARNPRLRLGLASRIRNRCRILCPFQKPGGVLAIEQNVCGSLENPILVKREGGRAKHEEEQCGRDDPPTSLRDLEI